MMKYKNSSPGIVVDRVITAQANSNIALVKYWGKRSIGEDCSDESLNLPANSSLSITFGDELSTITSIVFSEKLNEDEFYLNDKKIDLGEKEIQERFIVLSKLRGIAGTKLRARVVSRNFVPTASGFGSSASGMAALTFAAAKALGLGVETSRLSEIARIGSGSACRSLFGGFVEWKRGNESDGRDSVAKQLYQEGYWPELRLIVTALENPKKSISSRAGMRQTAKTSRLYKERIIGAEENVEALKAALREKDFEKVGEITMQDTMMMHAVMLDTRPPIMYLNDVSRETINTIEELNRKEGRIVAAYTYDAGPNAVILTLDKDFDKVMEALRKINGISKLIVPGIGRGARVLDESQSLIDPNTLLPLPGE
ncbi:diphosphomevalonate decarboxylase [Candidatus Marsarchaeota archaeon]|nr:diphosphomevalonate decarboxylase [Candidatus Marsarchaeota archaeon]